MNIAGVVPILPKISSSAIHDNFDDFSFSLPLSYLLFFQMGTDEPRRGSQILQRRMTIMDVSGQAKEENHKGGQLLWFRGLNRIQQQVTNCRLCCTFVSFSAHSQKIIEDIFQNYKKQLLNL